MGVCQSTSAEDAEAAKRNKEIDQMLAREGREMRKEVKLLLLGSGESGKSTIFKHLKLIQRGGGFTPEELNTYKYVVYGNIITQMKVIVNAAVKLGNKFDSEENRQRAMNLLTVGNGGDAWTPRVADDVKILWQDSGIQLTYTQRDRFYQLNDSAKYFFDAIDRISAPNYIPSNEDVLRARIRTTGIEEAEFAFDDLSFRMVDVGGQRSERRKWIHCFQQVTAVVFCVALSEYDQTLREDDTQNRMKESLLLFDEICNSPYFKDIAFILFLNKMDLFREKIARVDLKVCFPDYTGGCNVDAASSYIKARFLEQNQAAHPVYVHFTIAVNTENIEFVFKCVRETILQKILRDLF